MKNDHDKQRLIKDMTSDINVQHCQFKRGQQFVKHSRLFKYVLYIQLSTGHIEHEQTVCFARHKRPQQQINAA